MNQPRESIPTTHRIFFLILPYPITNLGCITHKEQLNTSKMRSDGYLKTAWIMTVLFSIILPLLKSGMATIGLFLALGYWNDWYNAMLYMNTETKYPLQYMLYALMQKTQAMSQMASSANIPLQDMPSNSLKLAMAVVATGPIILVYPFIQKYFVKGVTIGSVKG